MSPRQPGVKATWHGECRLCPHAIVPGDRVVRHGGGWIHVTCAPGQDDE